MKNSIRVSLALIALAVSIFAGPVTNPPPSVTLAWDLESPANSVTNYVIVFGESPLSLTNSADTGNTNLFTVTNVLRGHTYWFAALAQARGLSSSNSATITTNVSSIPAAPTGLTIQMSQ